MHDRLPLSKSSYYFVISLAVRESQQQFPQCPYKQAVLYIDAAVDVDGESPNVWANVLTYLAIYIIDLAWFQFQTILVTAKTHLFPSLLHSSRNSRLSRTDRPSSSSSPRHEVRDKRKKSRSTTVSFYSNTVSLLSRAWKASFQEIYHQKSFNYSGT